jgi:signal transduction histidine kinase
LEELDFYGKEHFVCVLQYDSETEYTSIRGRISETRKSGMSNDKSHADHFNSVNQQLTSRIVQTMNEKGILLRPELSRTCSQTTDSQPYLQWEHTQATPKI